MDKHASARWQGGLKDGRGNISTESGALAEAPYGFRTRFEGVRGANPEELVGAAHAACYSMALAAELGKAGLAADDISTRATVTLEKVGEQFTVTRIHLDVTARLAGSSGGGPADSAGDTRNAAFQRAAEATKTGCPISRLLNAEITLTARLNG